MSRDSLAPFGAARPVPPNHRSALLLGALLIVLLQRFVPYGQLLLYPFTLLSTWVHEMGHGLTALLSGGRFEELIIYGDASGLAKTAVIKGWRQAATAAGGLIAPPLVGALILASARYAARGILWVLSASLLLSLLLWVRTPVGWLAMAPLWLLCTLAARYGSAGGRLFFAQLVGLLLGLDTVARIGYFFMPSATVGGVQRPSDISGVSEVLGGSYRIWGGLLAAFACALLLLGLWVAFRPAKQRAAASSY